MTKEIDHAVEYRGPRPVWQNPYTRVSEILGATAQDNASQKKVSEVIDVQELCSDATNLLRRVAEIEDKKHRRKICEAMRRYFLEVMNGEHILCPEFIEKLKEGK
tara:strand:- start:393 stop:707 length:315 start_codon:yes stop_codon:yes gene_type:complete